MFLSKNYEDSWNSIHDDGTDASSFDADCFNFYVHAPSRTDTTACREDHDAITILGNINHITTTSNNTNATTNSTSTTNKANIISTR